MRRYATRAEANTFVPSGAWRTIAGYEDPQSPREQRDLSPKRYVYWWADGVYFNVRLDEERTCVLVLIGATEDGTKELLAVVDGYRESTQSWRELLGQLKRLGLSAAPKLAIGDGSLGFWSLCRKNMVRSPISVAGSIRPPISWIKCLRAFRAKRSN